MIGPDPSWARPNSPWPFSAARATRAATPIPNRGANLNPISDIWRQSIFALGAKLKSSPPNPPNLPFEVSSFLYTSFLWVHRFILKGAPGNPRHTSLGEEEEAEEMAESQHQDPPRKALKRKRASSVELESLTPEEKEARIDALTAEMDGLFRYYREVMDRKLGLETLSGGCGSLNGQIACLMEESDLPLSTLVEQIYGTVKERNEGVTVAAVKSGLLFVGQRFLYGVPNPDADVLEDHSPSSLWCWEVGRSFFCLLSFSTNPLVWLSINGVRFIASFGGCFLNL